MLTHSSLVHKEAALYDPFRKLLRGRAVKHVGFQLLAPSDFNAEAEIKAGNLFLQERGRGRANAAGSRVPALGGVLFIYFSLYFFNLNQVADLRGPL